MPDDEIHRLVQELLRIASADPRAALAAEMRIRAQFGG
jgi:hypothetical protein